MSLNDLNTLNQNGKDMFTNSFGNNSLNNSQNLNLQQNGIQLYPSQHYSHIRKILFFQDKNDPNVLYKLVQKDQQKSFFKYNMKFNKWIPVSTIPPISNLNPVSDFMDWYQDARDNWLNQQRLQNQVADDGVSYFVFNSEQENFFRQHNQKIQQFSPKGDWNHVSALPPNLIQIHKNDFKHWFDNFHDWNYFTNQSGHPSTFRKAMNNGTWVFQKLQNQNWVNIPEFPSGLKPVNFSSFWAYFIDFNTHQIFRQNEHKDNLINQEYFNNDWRSIQNIPLTAIQVDLIKLIQQKLEIDKKLRKMQNLLSKTQGEMISNQEKSPHFYTKDFNSTSYLNKIFQDKDNYIKILQQKHQNDIAEAEGQISDLVIQLKEEKNRNQSLEDEIAQLKMQMNNEMTDCKSSQSNFQNQINLLNQAKLGIQHQFEEIDNKYNSLNTDFMNNKNQYSSLEGKFSNCSNQLSENMRAMELREEALKKLNICGQNQKSTQQQLSHTQMQKQDLENRLNQIIEEKSNNIDQLRNQIENQTDTHNTKILQFKTQFENIISEKTKEIQLLNLRADEQNQNLRGLNSKNENLQYQLDQCKDRNHQFAQDKKNYMIKSQQLSQKILQTQNQFQQFSFKMQSMENQFQQCQKQKQNLIHQYDHCQMSSSKLNNMISQQKLVLENQIRNCEQKEHQYENKISGLNRTIQILHEQISQLKQSIKEFNDHIVELKNENVNCNQEITLKLDHQKNFYEGNIGKVRNELNSINDLFSQLKNQHHEKSTNLDNLNTEFDDIKKKYFDLGNTYESLKKSHSNRLSNCEQQVHGLNDSVREKDDFINDYKKQKVDYLDQIENLNNQMNGYQDQIKRDSDLCSQNFNRRIKEEEDMWGNKLKNTQKQWETQLNDLNYKQQNCLSSKNSLQQILLGNKSTFKKTELELQGRLDDLQGDFDSCRTRTSTWQNKSSLIQDEIAGIQRKFTMLQNNLEDCRSQLGNTKGQIENLKDNLTNKSKYLSKHQDRQQQQSEELDKLRANIYNNGIIVQDLKDDIKDLNVHMRDLNSGFGDKNGSTDKINALIGQINNKAIQMLESQNDIKDVCLKINALRPSITTVIYFIDPMNPQHQFKSMIINSQIKYFYKPDKTHKWKEIQAIPKRCIQVKYTGKHQEYFFMLNNDLYKGVPYDNFAIWRFYRYESNNWYVIEQIPHDCHKILEGPKWIFYQGMSDTTPQYRKTRIGQHYLFEQIDEEGRWHPCDRIPSNMKQINTPHGNSGLMNQIEVKRNDQNGQFYVDNNDNFFKVIQQNGHPAFFKLNPSGVWQPIEQMPQNVNEYTKPIFDYSQLDPSVKWKVYFVPGYNDYIYKICNFKGHQYIFKKYKNGKYIPCKHIPVNCVEKTTHHDEDDQNYFINDPSQMIKWNFKNDPEVPWFYYYMKNNRDVLFRKGFFNGLWYYFTKKVHGSWVQVLRLPENCVEISGPNNPKSKFTFNYYQSPSHTGVLFLKKQNKKTGEVFYYYQPDGQTGWKKQNQIPTDLAEYDFRKPDDYSFCNVEGNYDHLYKIERDGNFFKYFKIYNNGYKEPIKSLPRNTVYYPGSNEDFYQPRKWQYFKKHDKYFKCFEFNEEVCYEMSESGTWKFVQNPNLSMHNSQKIPKNRINWYSKQRWVYYANPYFDKSIFKATNINGEQQYFQSNKTNSWKRISYLPDACVRFLINNLLLIPNFEWKDYFGLNYQRGRIFNHNSDKITFKLQGSNWIRIQNGQHFTMTVNQFALTQNKSFDKSNLLNYVKWTYYYDPHDKDTLYKSGIVDQIEMFFSKSQNQPWQSIRQSPPQQIQVIPCDTHPVDMNWVYLRRPDETRWIYRKRYVQNQWVYQMFYKDAWIFTNAPFGDFLFNYSRVQNQYLQRNLKNIQQEELETIQTPNSRFDSFKDSYTPIFVHMPPNHQFENLRELSQINFATRPRFEYYLKPKIQIPQLEDMLLLFPEHSNFDEIRQCLPKEVILKYLNYKELEISPWHHLKEPSIPQGQNFSGKKNEFTISNMRLNFERPNVGKIVDTLLRGGDTGFGLQKPNLSGLSNFNQSLQFPNGKLNVGSSLSSLKPPEEAESS